MEGAPNVLSGKRRPNHDVITEQNAEIEELQKHITNVRVANQKLNCENATLKERLAQAVYSRKKAREGTCWLDRWRQARTVEEKQRVEIEELQKQITDMRQANFNLYCENKALEEELAEQDTLQKSDSCGKNVIGGDIDKKGKD